MNATLPVVTPPTLRCRYFQAAGKHFLCIEGEHAPAVVAIVDKPIINNLLLLSLLWLLCCGKIKKKIPFFLDIVYHFSVSYKSETTFNAIITAQVNLQSSILLFFESVKISSMLAGGQEKGKKNERLIQ